MEKVLMVQAVAVQQEVEVADILQEPLEVVE